MDMTWVTERVALGGGIWNARNMEEVAQSGVTHVLNMQVEFDDRPLAEPYGVAVLWNPTDDDFLPKPPELLERGVDFALAALRRSEGAIVCTLRGGGAPGPDDDAGGVVRDELEDWGSDGADRDAAAGGRLCGRLCGKRAAISGIARERVAVGFKRGPFHQGRVSFGL